MRRTIFDHTPDGLRQRLTDMERQIADLQRVRNPPATYVESSGGAAKLPFYVAASNASDESKALSDYVCTGTNDQVTINQAITDANTLAAANNVGVVVTLSEGEFQIAGTINLGTGATTALVAVSLVGQGRAETLLWGPGTDSGINGINISQQNTATGFYGSTVRGMWLHNFPVAIHEDPANLASNLAFVDLGFSSCTTGIELNVGMRTDIRDCHFQSCTAGIDVVVAIRSQIHSNTFVSNTTDIKAARMQGLFISENDSTDPSRFFDGQNDGSAIWDLRIADNRVEDASIQTLRVDGAAASVYGIDVSGNSFVASFWQYDVRIEDFATLASDSYQAPVFIEGNHLDGGMLLDAPKAMVSGNYFVDGIEVGTAGEEVVVTNNWLGDSGAWGATLDATLTDNTTGAIVQTGAGNYLDGTWT